MGRWSEASNGRADLVTFGGGIPNNWAIYRVILDDDGQDHGTGIDTGFIVKLRGDKQLKMEMYQELGEAIARCMEWVKS